MKLGDMVRNYRKEHGYSMEDFGKLCGLSRAYISLLESNRNPNTGKPISPSVNTLDKIASVMGMSFNELVASLDEDTIITSYDSLEDTVDDIDPKNDKLLPRYARNDINHKNDKQLPRYARKYPDNQEKSFSGGIKVTDFESEPIEPITPVYEEITSFSTTNSSSKSSNKLTDEEKDYILQMLARLDIPQLQKVRSYINMLIDMKQ